MLGLDETRVAVSQGELRAFTGGAGPPLVLLHGLGGASANWVGLAASAGAAHRLIALDLPGHGGSTPLPDGATVSSYADAVVEALTELSSEPVLLVGHSFGAHVALRLAQRRRDATRGVVLVCPSGIRPLRSRIRRLAAVVTRVRPAARIAALAMRHADQAWLRRLAFWPWLVSDPRSLTTESVRGFFTDVRAHADVHGARRALVGDDEEWVAISCPAVALWGACDRVVPVEDGYELARRGVPVRVVADCGHLLIAERPDVVMDAIAWIGDRVRPPV